MLPSTHSLLKLAAGTHEQGKEVDLLVRDVNQLLLESRDKSHHLALVKFCVLKKILHFGKILVLLILLRMSDHL